jgi:hypothetical protein
MEVEALAQDFAEGVAFGAFHGGFAEKKGE